MARLSLLAALALTGTSSALQIPLQLPFQSPWSSEPESVTPPHDEIKDLPLVDSETLQAQIHKFPLERRSQLFYSFAQQGEEEYGHPTRVIGSKGKLGVPGTTELG